MVHNCRTDGVKSLYDHGLQVGVLDHNVDDNSSSSSKSNCRALEPAKGVIPMMRTPLNSKSCRRPLQVRTAGFVVEAKNSQMLSRTDCFHNR